METATKRGRVAYELDQSCVFGAHMPCAVPDSREYHFRR